MDAHATNRHRQCFYCTVISSPIAYPGLALETAVIVISVILLIIGIEHIAGGILLYRKHCAAHIGIGILVIALAGAAVAFPIFAALVIIITLTALALLFSGISNILTGIGNRKDPSWAKAVNIEVGVLAVVVSSIALISPFFGAFLVALMITIEPLLVYME